MDQYLSHHNNFSDHCYHGKGMVSPAPARLFQALLAGARPVAYRQHWSSVEPVLQALERLAAPEVLASSFRQLPSYRIAVPNNDSDKAAREWKAGRAFNDADLRTLKTISPRALVGQAWRQASPLLFVGSGRLHSASGRLAPARVVSPHLWLGNRYGLRRLFSGQREGKTIPCVPRELFPLRARFEGGVARCACARIPAGSWGPTAVIATAAQELELTRKRAPPSTAKNDISAWAASSFIPRSSLYANWTQQPPIFRAVVTWHEGCRLDASCRS